MELLYQGPKLISLSRGNILFSFVAGLVSKEQ